MRNVFHWALMAVLSMLLIGALLPFAEGIAVPIAIVAAFPRSGLAWAIAISLMVIVVIPFAAVALIFRGTYGSFRSGR